MGRLQMQNLKFQLNTYFFPHKPAQEMSKNLFQIDASFSVFFDSFFDT